VAIVTDVAGVIQGVTARRAGWDAARMVLEIADIDVRPGTEEEFVAAFLGARDVLASTPGCHAVRMARGVESPSRFVLLVEWDSVEAHEVNFRNTERFATWRAEVGPFFASPPRVEHVADVTAAD
jgi:quinol monooxygenase YgiN